ncbi:strigolactone esterase D14-like [Nymphaea colorata]|nr:strigolactone esterase D14-like [Nymphaea colorata]
MGKRAPGYASLANVKFMSSCRENKKTIIISHGFGLDQSCWRHILPSLLENHYTVVTYDLVFSAASTLEDYADDLISLMDEFDLKSSFFLGHSMSAMVGCLASIKRPEFFHHLILLCASPRYLNSTDYEGGFEVSDIEAMLENMEKDFQSWTQGFAPAALGTEDPNLCKEFQDRLLSMTPEIAITLARSLYLGDHRDALHKVSVPATIVHTQNDIVVPVSVARYIHENLGGESSVVAIPAAGHMPQLTAPKLLIDALAKLLGTCDLDP